MRDKVDKANKALANKEGSEKKARFSKRLRIVQDCRLNQHNKSFACLSFGYMREFQVFQVLASTESRPDLQSTTV